MYCLVFSFLSLSLSLSLKKKGLERILGAFRGGVRHISGESCSRKTPPVIVNTVSGLLLDLLALVKTWLILDLQRVLAGFGLA